MDGQTICLFLIKTKTMACNKCKKKTTVEVAESNSNFKLRNVGIHQFAFGAGEFISNAHMTDELALAFLKLNPNNISLFEIFPENWKELLSNDKPQNEASKSKSK